MFSVSADKIISVRDLLGGLKNVRSRLESEEFLTVFSSNKPDMIVADVDFFSELLETREKYERSVIFNLVKEARARNNTIPFNADDYT